MASTAPPGLSSSSTTAIPPHPRSIAELFESVKEETEGKFNDSLDEFKQKIATANTGELRGLLTRLVHNEYHLRTAVNQRIPLIMQKIDQLDPLLHPVSPENRINKSNKLRSLIRFHGYNDDSTPNILLIAWLGWFIDRGISPDALDTDGYSPLLSAIDQKRADVVQLLLARGANQNLKITERGGSMFTALEWTEKFYVGDVQMNRIFDLLRVPAAPRVIPPNPTFTPLTTTGVFTESISSTGIQPSSTITPTPAPSPIKTTWTFTRSRAALTAAGTAIGLLAAYNWFTSKKQTVEPTEKANVLINTTGKPIWIAHNDSTDFTEITGNTYPLPELGILKIKASKSQPDESALPVKLEAANRLTNYLNITIYNRSKWTSWWLGPLGSSVNWVPHTIQ